MTANTPLAGLTLNWRKSSFPLLLLGPINWQTTLLVPAVVESRNTGQPRLSIKTRSSQRKENARARIFRRRRWRRPRRRKPAQTTMRMYTPVEEVTWLNYEPFFFGVIGHSYKSTFGCKVLFVFSPFSSSLNRYPKSVWDIIVWHCCWEITLRAICKLRV